jgi:DNA-binding CsgD family transcriptional regulator
MIMLQERDDRKSCACPSKARHLTGREIQVLLLATADMHDRQIAQQLGVSVRTIEQHVASMLRKAGAHSRGGLIGRAYALGILHSGVWPPQWSGGRCLANEVPSRAENGMNVVAWH